MNNLINLEKIKGIRIIGFCFDEINLQQRSEIKNLLRGLLDSGEKRFILNFSKLGFLSSLVIATLLSFVKECKNKGGLVKLCCLPQEAIAVLRITKLEKIFDVYDTEKEALKKYGAATEFQAGKNP